VQHREFPGANAPGPQGASKASRIAALDLGSRVFKAVLGEIQDQHIVTRLLGKRLVRLGTDVADNGGVISSETLADAKGALEELKSICAREGVTEIRAVATRAVRAAENGGDILAVARELGLTVEVVTGEREARLAYLAVTGGEAGSLVCELGSQSMQLAWRRSGPVETISVASGYEQIYPDLIDDAADFTQARNSYRAFLDREAQFPATGIYRLIGMAMNTMACFVTGMQKPEVTDQNLPHSLIRQKTQALCSLTGAEFQGAKSTLDRADKILSGLILIDYMLERTGKGEVFIAEAELPVGLIVEYFEGVGTR